MQTEIMLLPVSLLLDGMKKRVDRLFLLSRFSLPVYTCILFIFVLEKAQATRQLHDQNLFGSPLLMH